MLVALVAAVVTWGMWVKRAAENLRAMVPDGYFEFTPTSQVWWYFDSTEAYFTRITVAAVVTILGEAVSIAAAVLAIRIVRQINARQTSWAAHRQSMK